MGFLGHRRLVPHRLLLAWDCGSHVRIRLPGFRGSLADDHQTCYEIWSGSLSATGCDCRYELDLYRFILWTQMGATGIDCRSRGSHSLDIPSIIIFWGY